MKHPLQGILVFLIALSLQGCSPTYYIHLVDDSDPMHPTFCISEYSSGCIGSGVRAGSVSFYEIIEGTQNTFDNKFVWGLSHKTGPNLKYFTFGVEPEGYKESYSDPDDRDLKLNTFYSISSWAFFRLVKEDDLVKVEFFDADEYYDEYINLIKETNTAQ